MPVTFSRFKQLCVLLLFFHLLTLSLSAETIFPPVDLGISHIGAVTTDSTVTFYFNNRGASPVFSLLYGSDFALGAANCNGNFTSCALPITFKPRYPGLRRDLVIVRDNNNNLIGRMILTGTGTGPQVSVAPGVNKPVAWKEFHVAQVSVSVCDSAGNGYGTNYYSNQVFRVSAADHSITVVAGTDSAAGYNGDGGPATSAQLNAPGSLAIDPAGNIFIADTGNNVIRKVDAVTGVITTIAGNGIQGHIGDGGLATAAELTNPFSLAFDPAGNLYFLERGDQDNTTDYKIRKLDVAARTVSVFAGTGIEGNSGDGGPARQAAISPLDLGFDASGNLYVVQQSGSESEKGGLIRMIAGGIISRFAGSDSGQAADGAPALSTNFYDIRYLSFDAAGSVYFVEGVMRGVGSEPECCLAVRKLDASALHRVSTIFKPDPFLNQILMQSLAIDPAGNIYSSDDLSLGRIISTQSGPLNFPFTALGENSDLSQLIYYNTGNEAFNISKISIMGVNTEDFTQTNDCGSSLPAGGSCAISLAFVPQAVGGRSAVLSIVDEVTGSPRQIALNGAGLPAQQAVLNTAQLFFPYQEIGVTGSPQVLTISNPGSAPLNIISVSVSDPVFQITNNCGTTLAASAQCTIAVTFSPKQNGSVSAALTIIDNDDHSPQMVALAASAGGLASSVSISTSVLDFGMVAVDNFGSKQFSTSNSQKTIYVTNTGPGNLAGIDYGLNGANPYDFRIINGCSNALAANSNCGLSITFTPTGTGVRTAILQINAYPGQPTPTGLPQSVTLTGIGFQTNYARGGPGYMRVSADFDGDGKADFAVWRPSDGIWRVLPSSNPSAPIQQQWGLTGDVPVPGDFDGDGKADFAVWRPSNGTWYILPSSHPSSPLIQQWGLTGDIPLIGDFDDDGKADFAVWRPSIGTWYVRLSSNPQTTMIQQWGLSADIPLLGDFDGDGKADFTVWRPSNGTWYILPSSNPSSPLVQQWGLQGDTPVASDFDDDGQTDFAVWRPLTGTWFVISSRSPSAPIVQQWGLTGDVPVPGDFDGDGKADFAVWRPSLATWYVIPTSRPFSPIIQVWGERQDIVLSGDFLNSGNSELAVWHPDTGVWTVPASGTFSTPIVQQWGLFGDIPLLGDFDGDGKADFAVWRPSNGTWYILPSSHPLAPIVQQWGSPGDIPLIGDFDGDRKADFIVWRPSNGTWYVLPSSHPSSPIIKQWGLSGDIPFVARYDSNNGSDFIVWRPSNGVWYIFSTLHPDSPITVQWGLPGDVPLLAQLVTPFQLDLIVWRPSNGTWYVSSVSNDSLISSLYINGTSDDSLVSLGLPGDIPLPILGGIYPGHVKSVMLWSPAKNEVVPVRLPVGLPSNGPQQLGAPNDVPF